MIECASPVSIGVITGLGASQQMLKTNIPGSILVVSLIFLIVGFGISLNTSINWGMYFKIIGVVGAVGVAVALITRFLPSCDKD